MRGSGQSLVIQTAFVGDLLLSIPLLKELRALRPQDHVILLCRKGLGDYLLQARLVDSVLEVDKADSKSFKLAAAGLKSRHFNLILCPHESARSRLLVWRLKANLKIGYRGFLSSLIFNHVVERPMALPEAIRQLALLEPLQPKWKTRLNEFEAAQFRSGGQTEDGLMAVPGWASMSVERLVSLRKTWFNAVAGKKTLQPLASSPKLQQLIDKYNLFISNSSHLNTQIAKRLIFLAPGSVWNTKMWTLDGFTKVARDFLAQGHRVLVLGAPNEKDICEELVRRAPGSISVAGETSLYESAELLCLADLLVCNDSGAMHMAATIGVPTVSVFGPTVLEFGYRPWQNQARVVQTDLACRPCGKHGSKQCPIGTHDCMKLIRAEAVLKATEAVLATAQPPSQ